VAGLATTLGSGAMTSSIDDIGSASTILAIGTNTTQAHPVIALKVKKAARDGAKLIVANPKKIDLCRHASIFLQHKPGTDVALLMGMMKVIVDQGLCDKDFIKDRCENYDEFAASLSEFDLAKVEQITGVQGKLIEKAAKIYATNGPAALLYCMGITQHTHGTDNVFAISNLALITGNIGKPGTGIFPLRGQNNVQGSCDMGALPNVYPGYQQVEDSKNKEKFEKAWNAKLSDVPGLKHTELFDKVSDGTVKSVYLVGENPVLSDANANHAVESLKKIPFLVVQDIFMTETAKLADVVLPAVTFAEKDGTFSNTERRVQRIRQAIAPKGDSKVDWQITSEIAKKMKAEGFDYASSEDVMKEIASLVPSYAGISYERLENGGIQWPCPTADHPGTPLLHTEKFGTASGLGKLIPLKYRESAELPDSDYPFLLTTDRSLFHYHTSTMTRKVQGLEQLNSEDHLCINYSDAGKLGIADDEMLKVSSRRGELSVKARVTRACPPGVVSMTFHFAEAPVNVLTNAALDPVVKIPETKVCAVKVEKV
jgi:formate dehydrogenase (NADP+) alpha subunit